MLVKGALGAHKNLDNPASIHLKLKYSKSLFAPNIYVCWQILLKFYSEFLHRALCKMSKGFIDYGRSYEQKIFLQDFSLTHLSLGDLDEILEMQFSMLFY